MEERDGIDLLREIEPAIERILAYEIASVAAKMSQCHVRTKGPRVGLSERLE